MSTVSGNSRCWPCSSQWRLDSASHRTTNRLEAPHDPGPRQAQNHARELRRCGQRVNTGRLYTGHGGCRFAGNPCRLCGMLSTASFERRGERGVVSSESGRCLRARKKTKTRRRPVEQRFFTESLPLGDCGEWRAIGEEKGRALSAHDGVRQRVLIWAGTGVCRVFSKPWPHLLQQTCIEDQDSDPCDRRIVSLDSENRQGPKKKTPAYVQVAYPAPRPPRFFLIGQVVYEKKKKVRWAVVEVQDHGRDRLKESYHL